MDATSANPSAIDDGRPIILTDPPTAHPWVAFAVSAAACTDSQCACATMDLEITPLDAQGRPAPPEPGQRIKGSVSMDTQILSLDEPTAGTISAEVQGWLHMQLQSPDGRARLAERWRRLRGQCGDPAFRAEGTWRDEPGLMASYRAALPWEFDLVVVKDGKGYLAEDSYCITPECPCDDVVIYFHELGRVDGYYVGTAQASMSRMRRPQIEEGAVTAELWAQLVAEHDPSEFKHRHRTLRAAARPLTPHALPPRVGRNAPCPCGSGKKHKRCCGANPQRQ